MNFLMNYSSSTAISLNVPRVGFEPTYKRFLRPLPLPLGLHRAGIEPAFFRLKGGGSAIELPVRNVHTHREGFEPPADPLEEGCSYPLSYRCKVKSTVCFSIATCSNLLMFQSPLMHPAGLEPAPIRLRAGGSTIELRVRYISIPSNTAI